MLPAFRLKAVVKPAGETQQKLTFMALLRSRNIAVTCTIYAACSASFFAWLTGSPFIHEMVGWWPDGDWSSYVPQPSPS